MSPDAHSLLSMLAMLHDGARVTPKDVGLTTEQADAAALELEVISVERRPSGDALNPVYVIVAPDPHLALKASATPQRYDSPLD
jgi:hypothetical protein